MPPARLLPGHWKRLLLAAAQLPRVALATSPKPVSAGSGRPSSLESAKDRAEPRLVRRVARVLAFEFAECHGMAPAVTPVRVPAHKAAFAFPACNA